MKKSSSASVEPQPAASRGGAPPHVATPEARARPQRRDVSRNHEAILSAAVSVLTNDSDASMHEIAAASGIGRTTLYRHFPDRTTLIVAILGRLVTEVDTAVETVLAATEGQTTVARVAELVCAFAEFGDRYRFLQRFPEMTEIRQERGRDPHVTSKERLAELIRAGQKRGEIRDDLDADWLTEVLIQTIVSCPERLHSTPATRDRMLRATVDGLLPARER